MRNYNVIFYVFKKKSYHVKPFLNFCVCVFFQNQVTSRRRSVVTVRWSAETSGTFTPSSQDQPLYFVVIEINHDLEMSSIFCYIKNNSDRIKEFNFCCFNGLDGRGHLQTKNNSSKRRALYKDKKKNQIYDYNFFPPKIDHSLWLKFIF